MELFDFINTIFTNPSEYKKIDKADKQKYFFIFNRRMAINFPLQANVLQHLKINQNNVIDFWQHFLRKQYKYIPNWMYTKGVKKVQKNKEKKQEISNEIIKEYCKVHKIDSKVINDALRFYPEETLNELKTFETFSKQNNKNG